MSGNVERLHNGDTAWAALFDDLLSKPAFPIEMESESLEDAEATYVEHRRRCAAYVAPILDRSTRVTMEVSKRRSLVFVNPQLPSESVASKSKQA